MRCSNSAIQANEVYSARKVYILGPSSFIVLFVYKAQDFCSLEICQLAVDGGQIT